MNSITIIDQTNEFVCDRVSDMEGFERPQVISVVADVAKKSGAAYIGAKFGRRLLSWRCLISVDTLQSRRDLLAATRPGRLKTIQFETCDGLELETQVEITNIIMPYRLGVCPALIEAVSPDAAFYGQTVHTFTTDQTSVFGGGSIPAEVPMSLYSVGTMTGSIENVGSEEANPTFRIDGPGTQFIIGNSTTDKEFIIDYEIGTGEYIEVSRNSEYGLQVLLNGDTATPIYSSFTGDFWILEPGENVIRFVPSGGDGDTLLTITYQDAYIGI